ncbi:hypothetical protein MVES_000777 [Malassezia vespertilionis]|uniref:Uncharacterized protein n=1 Tax=Malassezia vespertilionis TaxID=2020962 RepID=A0A2N1JEZ9_9BASI|nr:hypothetical protein MVES_000777 [Malassezia vespertilionis]
MTSVTGTKQSDETYLLTYRAIQGSQIASLAATPIWMVPVIGSAIGAAAGYVQGSQFTPGILSRTVADVRADVSRRDDYQLIGSVVGALALPAIFLRSVGLFNGLLGGVGLGGATGVLTYYCHGWMHDETRLPSTGEKPIPEADVPK